MRESQDQIWVINDPLHLRHPITQTSQTSQRLPWWLTVVPQKGVGAHLGTSPPGGVGMGDLMQPPPPVGPRRSSQAICIPSLHCDLFFLLLLLARHPSIGAAWSLIKGETEVCVRPRRLITSQSSVILSYIWLLFSEGTWLSLKLRCAFRMALLAAVTAGHKPFIWMLSGNLVMAHCNSHCTHSSESFFFPPCLSGTFECCS